MAGLKERMAQNRMATESEESGMEEVEMGIEKTLGAMTSDMVDHLNNSQMRTMLKQAVEHFQSDKS